MLAMITKTSDWNYKEKREFNSLEELFQFKEECGNPIIIEAPLIDEWEVDYEIEIYDDYRE